MASYDTGYEDERFQHPVGQSFHCGICYNVVKDPTMCRHNEHLFCRACITRSLVNSQTCPSCAEPLTVETLTQPSRTVMNLLSELKIRCQFFNRGCEKFIELGDLEKHVADCGFAPAVCSNEGCRVEVNKQDLLHHETTVCELRRVQCHSCNEIRQEMDIVKVTLAAMNEKLKSIDKKLDRNERNVKTVEGDVVAQIQEQRKMQEERNHQLMADNVEMKKSLSEVRKELERLTKQTSHDVHAEESMKKGIAEADEPNRELKVVVIGGWNSKGSLNSVEMISLLNAAWTLLQPMKEPRQVASSFVYNNEIFVAGGYNNSRGVKSVEKLSLKTAKVNQRTTWENIPAELPKALYGHCSVVHYGRLIVIGGYDGSTYSDSITEISLDPPYSSRWLASMPQTRWLHSVVLFGSKILILGGRKSGGSHSSLKSVLLFDIIKNECIELAPLPYPINEMATVKWGDENVIIMGGMDGDGEVLNKVSIYNINTQNSLVLPSMKYERKGCVAVVVRDSVIVIGGRAENGKFLKSVERFRFEHFTWEELPEMLEERYCPTAVAF